MNKENQKKLNDWLSIYIYLAIFIGFPLGVALGGSVGWFLGWHATLLMGYKIISIENWGADGK